MQAAVGELSYKYGAGQARGTFSVGLGDAGDLEDVVLQTTGTDWLSNDSVPIRSEY